MRFLEDFLVDTLPSAPIDQLAVIRFDGDMYKSTIDAITALYLELSVGGYPIVDDYKSHLACQQTTNDYRGGHGIQDEIVDVDHGRACARDSL